MFGMLRGGLKQMVLLGGASLLVIVLFHQAIAHAFRTILCFKAAAASSSKADRC